MTPEQSSFIKAMEKSGRLAAQTLKFAATLVKAGVTTADIDKATHDFILSHGATPAPLNYKGYPKSICTSVNDMICHGVPDGTVLKDGDIVNIDVTTLLNGYHGDTSATFFVGDVSKLAKDISDCAQGAMFRGIEAIEPGAKTGDIGFAINKFVTQRGFHVVKEIGGHGIGKVFHDEPFVPSFGKKGRGDLLVPFRCITVEPMVNQTDAVIREFPIKGSQHCFYKTSDGTLSAQYEHTVLITDKGAQILTLD